MLSKSKTIRNELFYPIADALQMQFSVKYGDTVEGACDARGKQILTYPNPTTQKVQAGVMKVVSAALSMKHRASALAVLLGEQLYAVTFHDSTSDVMMTVIVEKVKPDYKFFSKKWNLAHDLYGLAGKCRVKKICVYDWTAKMWVSVPHPVKALIELSTRMENEDMDEILKDLTINA